MPATRTPSQTSDTESTRKRVCKACDRCRLKKSKCDGTSPCTRCKSDNAICRFGERKKAHDKIYPKGYVDELERQQELTVAAMQEMYLLLESGKPWPGAKLAKQSNGIPLTHDILHGLDLLKSKPGSPSDLESFEEDTQKIQDRLNAQDAGFSQRPPSVSSESDDQSLAGQHDFAARTPPQASVSPFESKHNPSDFNFNVPPRPNSQSPEVHDAPMFPGTEPSYVHNSTNTGDAQYMLPYMGNYAVQAPLLNAHDYVNQPLGMWTTAGSGPNVSADHPANYAHPFEDQQFLMPDQQYEMDPMADIIHYGPGP